MRISRKAVPDDDLRKLFKVIDVDHGATLDTIELSRFFNRIKPARKKSIFPQQADNPCMHIRIRRIILNAIRGKGKSHLAMLWREYDKDGSNTLNFSEFRDLMRKSLKISRIELPDIDLKMFFKYLDDNKDYTLDWDELFTFVYGQMSDVLFLIFHLLNQFPNFNSKLNIMIDCV